MNIKTILIKKKSDWDKNQEKYFQSIVRDFEQKKNEQEESQDKEEEKENKLCKKIY